MISLTNSFESVLGLLNISFFIAKSCSLVAQTKSFMPKKTFANAALKLDSDAESSNIAREDSSFNTALLLVGTLLQNDSRLRQKLSLIVELGIKCAAFFKKKNAESTLSLLRNR